MLRKLIFILGLSLLSFITHAQESAKPWLGVAIEKGINGVRVEKALPDTPALNAGILPMDEIIKVDQTAVKTPRELVEVITNKGIGNTVKVELLRDGKKVIKSITLVGRPDMLDVAKKALMNKIAPAIKAKAIKGYNKNEFDLSAHKGEVIIIEFWATWCPACVSSYPRLIEFSKKYKNIKIVTITNEPAKKVKKFLDKNPHKIPGLSDSQIIYLISGTGVDDIGQKYYSSSIPMFVLINKAGKVEDLTVGAGKMLEEILSKAVKIQ